MVQTYFSSIFFCLLSMVGLAQFQVPANTSWQQTRQEKTGSISVLWYDIEPFIYRNSSKDVIGVEYELMEGFKGFVKQHYGVDLTIKWVDAKSFDNIFPYIEQSTDKGLFGLSFYSITEERKKVVKFSPPYMPDLNVLVTNNSLPVYDSDESFISDLPKLKGYTMKQTTMEDDLKKLQHDHYPALPILNQVDDYEVLKQISEYKNAFGYVPVSIYVIALQRGIKIKRQRVMGTRREGFAAIYTKASDWDEPVDAYFKSPECQVLVAGLIRKYLGPEVANIILDVSLKDSLDGKPSDIELLTREREIVTQRLIDTALDAEKSRTQRNFFLLVLGAAIIIAGVAFSRYQTKNRLSKILQQRNRVIEEQKEKMEELNRQLNMKILQSKLNPHFLFNSLNCIQYHIGADDKQGALQYIARFSGFLRQVLQSSDEILIPAAIEAALVEKYLWLEQNRFPDKFTYAVHTDNEAKHAETPPLLVHSILQEILYTNILNSPANGAYFLQVDFVMEDAMLAIKISDNGPSVTEADTLQRRKGLPENTDDILQQRLEAINQSATAKLAIVYSRANDINKAELKIPQPLFIA